MVSLGSAQGHCHAFNSLIVLVKRMFNIQAYKDILYNSDSLSNSKAHLSSPCDLEDLHCAGDDVLHGVLTDAAQEDGGDFSKSGGIGGHTSLSGYQAS